LVVIAFVAPGVTDFLLRIHIQDSARFFSRSGGLEVAEAHGRIYGRPMSPMSMSPMSAMSAMAHVPCLAHVLVGFCARVGWVGWGRNLLGSLHGQSVDAVESCRHCADDRNHARRGIRLWVTTMGRSLKFVLDYRADRADRPGRKTLGVPSFHIAAGRGRDVMDGCGGHARGRNH